MSDEFIKLWLVEKPKNTCVVVTQRPRYTPDSYYAQARFLYFSHVDHVDAQRRLREMGIHE